MSGMFHWGAASGCLAKCHVFVKKRMGHSRNSYNPMYESAGKGKPDRRQTKMTAN